MMEYRFHPEARQEMKESARGYSNIRPQLGRNFREQIEDAISRILIHPDMWHPLGEGYRRCQIKQFPYGIIYKVDEEEQCCSIYAVMHLHRKPGYWKRRKL